ncbi:hypothetical protein FNYG_15313 [Fusarium nygamai]|uniref:Uncharacterized protein n=1 Tax=Gibberella nygamai TaxID=42673 RepID=A0A2K0UGI5_GIBNY|nr:hypothetical protein FNYG_15313 [Fusarium nygamai]
MAERGNGYIRACYSLLTKIRSTIKLPEMMGQVSVNGQAVLDNQPHGEGIVGSTALVPTIPGEQNQAYSLNFEGDPALWAEVLESIDIGMDRQWIEMALRRGQHVETPDTP